MFKKIVEINVIGEPVPNNTKFRIIFPKMEFIQDLFYKFKSTRISLPHLLNVLRNKLFLNSYKPGKLNDWQKQIINQASKFRTKEIDDVWENPIKIIIEFRFQRPKSVSEKKRPLHTVKPDFDNLGKPVVDCLQKLRFFKNDSQIFYAKIKKKYSDEPGFYVWINYI